MSGLEFSATLRQRIQKKLKDRGETASRAAKTDIGALVRDVSEDVKVYRGKLENLKGVYESIYTKEGLAKLEQVIRVEVSSNINLDFNELQKVVIENDANASTNITTNSMQGIDDPWLIQKNSNYTTAMNNIKQYINSKYKDIIPADYLKELLDSGHITGIAAERVSNTFYDTGAQIDKNARVVTNSLDSGQEYLDKVLQLLLDLDLATSNSVKFDYGIYTNSIKHLGNRNLISVEVQLKKENQNAGNQIATIMKTLSAISKELVVHSNSDTSSPMKIKTELNIGTEKNKDWMMQVLQNISDDTTKQLAIDNFNWLLTTKGSPSILQMIESKLIASLDEKRPDKYNREYRISNQLVLKDSVLILDTKELNKFSKVLAAKLNKEKKVIEELSKRLKQSQVRNKKGQFTSLINIKNLLNQKLVQQVTENMGTPALNYKTGRFAHSTRVEDVKMQRDGAIAIFYTYMKNPYQTFEPGFRQGSTQRDPKALISKSIREIAQHLVTSQLRTIRV